ncbi:MAG TPA: YceI family protein [Vitreimonas sp.]|uniref:YceI family protein n=1 Tax=Vitreimonas sp. TaxID=3069702 RepID=UPI002D461376|nr:YceI family protein [Vitreimonas sp.]HYD89054.1 YceI family protein [Vitreimonas sp.]
MRVLSLLLCFGLAACVSIEGAADRPPPFSAAAAAPAAETYPIAVDLPAGTYRLDPRHASVLFRIRHQALAYFVARFDTKDAAFEFDPADPSRSRLTASVDAASVNTGLVNNRGERSFDRSIGRALGAERTPQISFVSTAIERTGAHAARVTGDLTMNGQTHPMTLEVTFAGASIDPLRGGAQVLGFAGHGEIDRTLWGVGAWRGLAGDEVQIVIEAELVRD